eukprot:9839596-Lingulodinium_polyedra.AAC.1
MLGSRPALVEVWRSGIATPVASKTASTIRGCVASYGCACRGSGLFSPGSSSPVRNTACCRIHWARSVALRTPCALQKACNLRMPGCRRQLAESVARTAVV